MFQKKIIDILTLFTSASTLICCALPALLVTLGAGSVMAGLASSFPQLIWLSRHKVAIFVFSGFMLLAGAFIRFYSKNLACPADRNLAVTCGQSRKVNNILYGFSLVIYLIGFFFAFIAPKLF